MSEKVTFGLAEPYLKDIKEAKDVFTFLQSKTYNPLTPDQDKQLKEALDSAGSSILKAAENDGKYLAGDAVSTFVYTKVMAKAGFNEFSEKINGRIAQIAFPSVVVSTFDGDFLDLLSGHWFEATVLTWSIIALSALASEQESISGDPAKVILDALPADARKGAEEVVEKAKTIFTPEAELTNSRASMAALGLFILTAYIF